MIRIPPAVDLELHDIAERAAGKDTTLIDAMGWTRGDFVAAIQRAVEGQVARDAGGGVTVKFNCDRCGVEVSDFWDSPPTCNRCHVLAAIQNAIWTELERQADDPYNGPWVDRDKGVIDGRVDMGQVADAVLKVWDDAYGSDHEDDLRDYLTQTGWR